MDIRTRLEKLISKTFICGLIGFIIMYFKPELSIPAIEMVGIVAGHHIAKDFFDMKKATK